MKKIKAIIGIFVIALIGSSIFYSCKKDNSDYLLQEKIKSHKNAIDENDFQWVHDAFLNAFESITNDLGSEEINNSVIYAERMEFFLQNAIENNGYKWIYEDREEIGDKEIEYMGVFKQIFFHDRANINVEFHRHLEDIKNLNIGYVTEARLYIYAKSLIAMNDISVILSQKIESGEIIINDDDEPECTEANRPRESYNYQNAESKAERKLFSCLEYKLDAVFSDNNPVDIAQFVLSAPVSLAWYTGSCVWEIAVGKWNHVN